MLESHLTEFAKTGTGIGSYKEWYSVMERHIQKRYTNGKIDDKSYKKWDTDGCLVSFE